MNPTGPAAGSDPAESDVAPNPAPSGSRGMDIVGEDAERRGESAVRQGVDRPPPPRRPLVTTLAMIGFGLVAFITGLLVFNHVVMPRLIHSTGLTQVPDITNMTYEQAEVALKPLGMPLSRAGERFDPNVPRGFVLSQDPLPNTPVRGKKRVMVVVSLGEEFSSVPGLFGESVRSARYLLQRSGLRVSGITRAPSQEVGLGLVSGTDPPAEVVLPRFGTVSLLISTGGGDEAWVMPDLLGREITNARRQLESFGFKVVTPPAAPTKGPIVYQDPPAGTRVTLETEISLQGMGRVIR